MRAGRIVAVIAGALMAFAGFGGTDPGSRPVPAPRRPRSRRAHSRRRVATIWSVRCPGAQPDDACDRAG
jgi:hypothetical protein